MAYSVLYQTFTSNSYGKKNGNNQEEPREGSHNWCWYNRKMVFLPHAVTFWPKGKNQAKVFWQ